MKPEDIDWVALKAELNRLLAQYGLGLYEEQGQWAMRADCMDGINVSFVLKRED